MSITRHDQTSILSQAVQYGDTVYLAGVVAKNLDQDVKGQTKQVLDDIHRLLANAARTVEGAAGDHLVTDIRNRAPMNEIWTAWVDANNFPARACIEASWPIPRRWSRSWDRSTVACAISPVAPDRAAPDMGPTEWVGP